MRSDSGKTNQMMMSQTSHHQQMSQTSRMHLTSRMSQTSPN
jgi:hypothetical protein